MVTTKAVLETPSRSAGSVLVRASPGVPMHLQHSMWPPLFHIGLGGQVGLTAALQLLDRQGRLASSSSGIPFFKTNVNEDRTSGVDPMKTGGDNDR